MRWLISKLLIVPMIVWAVWLFNIAWEQSAKYDTLDDWGMAIALYFIFAGLPIGVLEALRKKIYTPPPKPRRPAPKASPKPSAVPVSIPKPKPVPEAPAEAHRPQERLFARPPMVEVVQPSKQAVGRAMDAKLGRFIEDGERAIRSDE